MSADNTFELKFVVDKSEVGPNFDAVAANAQEFANSVNMQADKIGGSYANAFSGITQKSKEMAASVDSDAISHAKLTAEVNALGKESQRAYRLMTSGLGDAEANARLYASTLTQLTAKQMELAASSHSVVSGQQAASAAIRSFEGNPGIRAVEGFLSKTLGLGPALQGIFPYVGALAFFDILKNISEKVYEVAREGVTGADRIGEAYNKLNEKGAVANDTLNVTAARLQVEIDKLENKPGGGLELAIAQVIQRADELKVSLRGDTEALAALLKENDVSRISGALTGVADTQKQNKDLTADQVALSRELAAIQDQKEIAVAGAKTAEEIEKAGEVASAATRAAFQKRIDVLRSESHRLKDSQAEAQKASIEAANAGEGSVGINPLDYSAQIKNVDGDIQRLVIAQAHAESEQRVAGLNARKASDEEAKELTAQKKREAEEAKAAGREVAAAAREATQERMRADEEGLSELRLAGKVSAAEEFEYWGLRKQKYAIGSEAYKQEVAKQAAAGQRMIAEHAEAQKAQLKDAAEGEAAAAKGMAAMSKWVQETNDDLNKTGERWNSYWKEVAKGQEALAANAAKMFELDIHTWEAQGAITALAAAQLLAGVHTGEHTERLVALYAMLQKLKAEGANLQPGTKDYEKNQTQQQGVQNQIGAEQGAGQLQAKQDQVTIGNNIAKPYLNAFNQINNGWLKVQNDLIAGNGHIKRDFAQMGLGLVQDMAKNFEQMLVHAVHYEIAQTAAHKTAQVANTATDIAGAATSDTISALSALKQMSHAAAVAAAKAWGAFADIPVIGPELGAVAAAATYAGVMALAAFEEGTPYVPRTGIAMLHKGEAVLDSPSASAMREMMGGGGGRSSGDININLGHSSFSSGNSDFRSQLRQHRMALKQEIKSLHRDGHLSGITSARQGR